MGVMSHLVRAEFAARRLWSRVRISLQERMTGFSDREAADFLSVLDATYGKLAEYPNVAPNVPESRAPRVVTELGVAERDAVWQCEELFPTALWNPLYRWDAHVGSWMYFRHGYWTESVSGDGVVSGQSIDPLGDLTVRFTELFDHPHIRL